MTITRKRKKEILIEYFENELEGEPNNQLINSIFQSARWPIQAKFNQGDNLLDRVVLLIPGNELYELFFDCYDELNKKFDFQHHEDKLFKVPFAIQNLATKYYSIETQNTKEQAWTSTLHFCSYIITIFFAKLFYDWKIKQLTAKQNFQCIELDNHALQQRSRQRQNGSTYGLLGKISAVYETPEYHNNANKKDDFKSLLFSKKNNVRKFNLFSEGIPSRHTYTDTFLGTKQQIEDTKRKYQKCR